MAARASRGAALLPTWGWMVPLLIVVCALGARLLTIDSFWYDEYITLRFAGGAHNGPFSLIDIWNVTAAEPYWPPGYLALAAGWAGLTGWSEFTGRALSLLVGLLAVAFTYRLGRDAGGSATAAISAAVIIAGSAFFSLYMHEMRGYTLVALFSALTAWAYWRCALAPQPPRIWHGVLLLVGAAGLLYTHYFAALLGIAIGLYHLLFVRKDRRWWLTLGWLAAGAALFVPWILAALPAFASAYAWQNSVTRVALMDAPTALQRMGSEFSNGSAALMALFLCFGVTVRARGARYIAFLAIVWLAAALLINIPLELLIHIRYLIGLLPLVAVLAGIGIAALAQRRVSPALLLGLWLVAGFGLYADRAYLRMMNGGSFWHLPWRPLADAVRPHAQDGDLVVMHLPDIVWRWMHDPLADYYFYGLPVHAEQMESLPGMSGEDYAALARQYMEGYRRLWFAYDPSQPPERRALFEQIAGEQFASCGAPRSDDALHLELFARIPQEPLAVFGGGIQMSLLEPLPASAAGGMTALLGWRLAPDVPTDRYSVGVHLTDAAAPDSLPAAQSDVGIPNRAESCLDLRLDTRGLRAGAYDVFVIVYDWQNGERLPVTLADGSGAGDRLLLGTVQAE